MAKLTVTVSLAVLLFLFTTLTSAETPSNLPEKDDVTNPTLLLPTERKQQQQEKESGETITATVIDVAPENTVETVPLKIVRFRHFPASRLGSLRLPLRHRRPCHHHGMNIPTIEPRQVSFGDDMIVAPLEKMDREKDDHESLREAVEWWFGRHHHQGRIYPRLRLGKRLHDVIEKEKLREKGGEGLLGSVRKFLKDMNHF